MSLLALVAMLLLALVPTAGRLAGGLAPATGTFATDAWAQMCTMSGLKLVKIVADAAGDASGPVSPRPGRAPKPAGSGGGDGMQGPDCAYCPVLGAMVAMLAWVLLAFPQATARLLPLRLHGPARIFRYPSGLGSRGPPIFL